MDRFKRIAAVAVIMVVLVFGYGVIALVKIADRVAADIADLAVSERAQSEKMAAPRTAPVAPAAKPVLAPVAPKPAQPAPVAPAVKLQENPKAQPLPAKPQVAVPNGGLVGWWKGEGNANDSIGENHGAAMNGVSFAAGRVGEAFSFDGVDDYVNAGFGGNLDDIRVLTIEAWIFLNSYGKGPAAAKNSVPVGRIVSKQIGQNLNGFNFAVRGGQYQDLAFVRHFSGGLAAWVTPVSSIKLGRWHHVAVVYESRSVTNIPKLFVDGEALPVKATAKAVGFATPDSSSNMIIGARQVNSKTIDCFFDGLIDELRVYNDPLTADEVRSSYDAGSAGKSEAPVRQESVAPKPQPLAPKVAPAASQKEASAADPAVLAACDTQVKRLVELKFHEAAKLTAEEFSALASAPNSADALLVVNEDFVPIAKQCELLEVAVVESFDFEKHSNLAAVSAEKLYWRYGLEPGKTTRGLTVAKAREQLKRGNRMPATTAEVLAIFAQNPKILSGESGLDAAGSVYDGERSPHLSRRIRELKTEAGAPVDPKKEEEIRKQAEEKILEIRKRFEGGSLTTVQLAKAEAGIRTWQEDAFRALRPAPLKFEVLELGMGLINKGHPDWSSPSFAK